MTRLSSPVRFALLSLGGVALAALILAIIAVRALRQEPSPADFLPTGRTVALFHGMGEKERTHLLPHFPALRDLPTLPVSGSGVDVAVLRTDNGAFGWITFLSGDIARTISSRGPHDTDVFVIRASAPELEAFLSPAPHETLGSDPSFRAFRPERAEAASWTYLDARLLGTNASHTDRALLDRLHSPFILIRRQGEDTALSVRWNGAMDDVLAPAPAPLSPAPSFLFAAGSLRTAYEAFASVLPEPQRLLLEGMLLHAWDGTTGGDVSLREELLPLLSGPGLLAGRTASGTVRILLQGTEIGGARREEVLDALHRSVGKSLATKVVSRQGLAQGFRAVTVEDDAAGIRKEQLSEDGWDIRRTTDAEGTRGLYSATSGRSFILATDPGWFAQALAGGTPAVSRTPGRPVAAGRFSNGFVQERVKANLDLRLLPALLAAFHGGTPASWPWTLERRSDVLTITLQGNDR
ncbi:MAG: hypothetical protein PHW10_04005 [Candidatus Peribacteraceae bacterium]|nr:hypothetical protein [Candidatus Peribacteraceae bacterium]